MKKIIGRGAEANLFRKDSSSDLFSKGRSKQIKEVLIIKDRIVKKYRHKILDEKLRFSRTKREAKVLEKLSKENFPCPRLLGTNDKDKLIVSFIEGKQLKESFDENYEQHSKEIAKLIAKMHNLGIIHGDLTTSNMLFNEKSKQSKYYFVDFGLSFFSEKIEDKAVDIHLFDRAIESKHYQHYNEAMKIFLEEYTKHADDGIKILKRFLAVQQRGRNKIKY